VLGFLARDDLLCVSGDNVKVGFASSGAGTTTGFFGKAFSELRVLSSFLTKLLGRRFVFPKILVFAESSSRTTSSSFLIFHLLRRRS